MRSTTRFRLGELGDTSTTAMVSSRKFETNRSFLPGGFFPEIVTAAYGPRPTEVRKKYGPGSMYDVVLLRLPTLKVWIRSSVLLPTYTASTGGVAIGR